MVRLECVLLGGQKTSYIWNRIGSPPPAGSDNDACLKRQKCINENYQ